MQIKLEKGILLLGASALASAVVTKVQVTLPNDPTIQDAGMRNLNLTAWQLTKIFYNGLSQAFDDDKATDGWIVPTTGLGAIQLPDSAASVTSFVSSILTAAGAPDASGILALITKFLGGGTPAPVPTPSPTPIPSPGVPVK